MRKLSVHSDEFTAQQNHEKEERKMKDEMSGESSALLAEPGRNETRIALSKLKRLQVQTMVILRLSTH